MTDYSTAARAVAFRPFTLRAPIGDVAIIPPFNGEGISKNEGIAPAYTRSGHAWILQQWHRNAGTLAAFATLPADGVCRDVHAVGGRTKPRGVAWTTPHGMVLSLTPDGVADPGTIRAEFRRLVGLGACR
ncbi:hypothetical protein WPS_32590 [Vulcanimicrobium alpinum]|uniref:Uncharacterized protein n=1 Tax=Vulcanimicrobium alpinum TaxID=3016050 RepID=A0AAN1XZ05_UNVUL|nr:hypothetical protein [Vulcanimicrobium alpinum]BDE07983.1 hypothetical protein WPS_32590 [Vulcanimicrobium alpinum]